MKKAILKLFGIVAVLLLAVSCTQISDYTDSEASKQNASGTGFVVISLCCDSDANARTVLPSDGSVEDFTNFEFFKKASSESNFASLATWNDYTDFYKNSKEFNLDAGTYTFKLTAKRYGVSFSNTVIVTIEANKKYTITFTLAVDSENTADSGYLYVDFCITSGASLYDSVEKITATFGTKEEKLEFTGTGYKKVVYKKNSVKEGNYLLTFKAYNSSDEVIFTYPTYVVVQAGYPSSKTIFVEEGQAVSENLDATSYTITYNSNYASGSATFSQTFYTGSAVVSVSTAGFSVSGKTFRYWNTNADGTGIIYKPGEQPAISSDTTLYAIWRDTGAYDLTYHLNDGSSTDKTYVEKEQIGSISLKATTDSNLNFSVSGKAFMDWDTSVDGSGTRYDAKSLFTSESDVELYAQWCTYDSSSSTYIVSSATDWNAFFNAVANQTAISENVTLGDDLDNPNLNFTNGKTLSGSFNGNSKTICDITSNLFDKVTGTVKDLKLEGYTYINASGVVANENSGTISGCTVLNLIVSGRGDYAGGIVGNNLGEISGCKFGAKLSSSCKYAGGIAAYNTGTINSTNTVAGSVSGSSADDAYYGYVIGYNEGGTVSTEIEAPAVSKYNNQSYSVDSSTTTAYTFELTRTSVLTLSVTDASGGGAIYGNISETKFSDASKTGIVMTGKVNGTTVTKTTTKYLTKGTYYVNLQNENAFSASTGTFSLTIK